MTRGAILTDDDIAEILLADPSVPTTELARRYGVTENPIYKVRKRMTFRAIRIAKSLGLIPLSPRRKVWKPKSRELITVSSSAARRA
jgi:hypothetical protein